MARKKVLSVTQKSTRPKHLDQSPEAKARRKEAKKKYKENRLKVLAAQKKGRRQMSDEEKQEAAERRIALRAIKNGKDPKVAVKEYRKK